VYHPEYKPSFLIADLDGEARFLFVTIAAILFIGSEIMNFMCHLHFSNMEEKMAAAVLKSSNE